MKDRVRARGPSILRSLAPFVIALVVYGGVLAIMRPVPNGDEPHYMLDAYSIARDGDRDLTEDYLDVQRMLWVYPGSFEPHAYHFRKGGPLVSYHGVGLPLLLTPVAAVARGWTYLRMAMVAIAALAAALLFSILRTLAPEWRWRRWGLWALVVFSWPMLGYSNQIYPELPGALMVLIAVWALLTPRLATWRIVLATAAAGYLPFLHIRFVPVAAGLGLAILARTIQVRRRGTRRELAVGVGAMVGTVAVFTIALAVLFQHWYGSPLPTAPLRVSYAIPGPTDSDTVAYSASNSLRQPILRHLWPMFTGGRQGWLPYAPWGLVALAGTLVLVLRRNWWVAGGALTALAYLAVVASSGVGVGASFPGRFSLVFLPLLAVPLVFVLRSSRAMAAVTWTLAAASLVIAIGALDHWKYLYGDGAGPVRLGLATALVRPWTPGSIPTPPTAAAVKADAGPTQELSPPLIAGAAGRLTTSGEEVTAVPRAPGSMGVLAWTRPVTLWRGEYVAQFWIAADGVTGAPPGPVGELRVNIGGHTYIDEHFDRRALLASGYRLVPRRFWTPGGLPVSAAVATDGLLKLGVAPVTFQPAAVTPPPGVSAAAALIAPAPPRGVLERGQLWVFLIVVLAAAIVVLGRRGPRGLALPLRAPAG